MRTATRTTAYAPAGAEFGCRGSKWCTPGVSLVSALPQVASTWGITRLSHVPRWDYHGLGGQHTSPPVSAHAVASATQDTLGCPSPQNHFCCLLVDVLTHGLLKSILPDLSEKHNIHHTVARSPTRMVKLLLVVETNNHTTQGMITLHLGVGTWVLL